MSAKRGKSETKKIPLKTLFSALGRKQRDFYDGLDEEERKSFSNYLTLRYVSSVRAASDFQNYYLRSTNLYVNRNFFSIPKEHAKLQWLVLTTVSPDVGVLDHEWIPSISKKSKSDDKKKMTLLLKMYPHHKIDDLEVMASLMTESEVTALAEDYGIAAKN
jgi:hypothetical protein